MPVFFVCAGLLGLMAAMLTVHVGLMRGRKRIWIYPVDEAHMPQQGMENIMLKQQTEDLPYRRDMDAAAQVFDLEPGMAVLTKPFSIETMAARIRSIIEAGRERERRP